LYKNFHTNEEALAAVVKGREEGLHYFFELYYEPLCYFVFKIVHDTAIAEEITADVFIKLWNNRATLTPNGSVKAMLHEMGRNGSIDYLRKQKRMAVREEGLYYISLQPEKTVLQTLIETETVRQIINTLQSLPPKCSEVFKLSFLFGKTDIEIAAALNLSPHTIRNQKQRAIRLLKEKLLPILFILLCIP
jgi:RNA polymerase sigma-70 factor (family 1)